MCSQHSSMRSREEVPLHLTVYSSHLIFIFMLLRWKPRFLLSQGVSGSSKYEFSAMQRARTRKEALLSLSKGHFWTALGVNTGVGVGVAERGGW